MSRFSSTRSGIVGVFVVLAASAGCGSDIDTDDLVAQANSSNIQRLANLYTAYQTDNGWRGPADEAKFKAFIRGFDAQKLQRIGVDPNAIDALFTSERDGQPFKIRLSVMGSAMGSSEPVIFESLGVDGRRQVGFLNMTQSEVDEAEYESLWARGAPPTNPPREH